MRPALFLASLCSAAALTLPASADPLYQITFATTGATAGSLSFNLDPATPYIRTIGYEFTYRNLSASANGTPLTLTEIDFDPTNDGEPISLQGATSSGSLFSDQLYFFENLLSGTPDGTPPVITPGTYLGEVVCTVSVRSPFQAASGLPPTLAFLQMQFPFTDTCGASVTATVTRTTLPTSPSSVTPEPASLGLLATGLLGIGGLLRRRTHPEQRGS